MTDITRRGVFGALTAFLGSCLGIRATPPPPAKNRNTAKLFRLVTTSAPGSVDMGWEEIAWSAVKPGMTVLLIDIHDGKLHRFERSVIGPNGYHQYKDGIDAIEVVPGVDENLLDRETLKCMTDTSASFRGKVRYMIRCRHRCPACMRAEQMQDVLDAGMEKLLYEAGVPTSVFAGREAGAQYALHTNGALRAAAERLFTRRG